MGLTVEFSERDEGTAKLELGLLHSILNREGHCVIVTQHSPVLHLGTPKWIQTN